MKHEVQASKVVTVVTNAVEAPVTCKLRLGVSKQSINVLSLSEKLVDAGVVALIIHGRSGEKKFGLPVDHEIIKEAVRTLAVPIIANGGIYTALDAQRILKGTGAAAVMPGRGLLGNPWIIPEILSILSKHNYSPPRLQQKKDTCLEHLHLYQQGGDMVRVGGLDYVCDPTASAGNRISGMTLNNGQKVDPSRKYKVAGWPTVNSQAPGRPIWEVVADYLRTQKEVRIKKLNTPKLTNIAGNPGIADYHKA